MPHQGGCHFDPGVGEARVCNTLRPGSECGAGCRTWMGVGAQAIVDWSGVTEGEWPGGDGLRSTPAIAPPPAPFG
jgi:hypothetical protein